MEEHKPIPVFAPKKFEEKPTREDRQIRMPEGGQRIQDDRQARMPDERPIRMPEEKPKKNLEDRSRSIELNTTFVPVTDKPVGLQYDDFLPKINPEVDTVKILQEIGENHNNFLSVLQRRSENICLILK